MIRDEIVAEALTWNDTPYHHQAMVKGIGVDCAQLVAGIGFATGCAPLQVIPTYSTQWHLHNKEERLLETLHSFGCQEINIDDAQPGDILTFTFGRVNSHLAILLDNQQIIHARLDIGKVCINELTGEWKERLTKAYKFPKVE